MKKILLGCFYSFLFLINSLSSEFLYPDQEFFEESYLLHVDLQGTRFYTFMDETATCMHTFSNLLKESTLTSREKAKILETLRFSFDKKTTTKEWKEALSFSCLLLSQQNSSKMVQAVLLDALVDKFGEEIEIYFGAEVLELLLEIHLPKDVPPYEAKLYFSPLFPLLSEEAVYLLQSKLEKEAPENTEKGCES